MKSLQEIIFNCDYCTFFYDFFSNDQTRSSTTYENFKYNFMKFGQEVMSSYLQDTIYEGYPCLCFSTPKMDVSGRYVMDTNMIFINEDIVKKMYKGDFTLLSVLFHELYHFKTNYDLKLGHINEDLVRIVKEDCLRDCSLYPSFIKGLKGKNNYYNKNYNYYSEELLADLDSMNNLLLFIKKAHMKVPQITYDQIDAHKRNFEAKYKNYMRDVSENLNFNSYVIDFEEAFDILVKDNPSWLEKPQLQIEYYIHNGKVQKRTTEQLKELLDETNNPEVKEYITSLLNNKKEKANINFIKKRTFC